MSTAQLLALDWGTSTLRASLLGSGGRVLHTRRDPRGVMAVPANGFEAVLREVCGDWLAVQPGLPLLASGMVGSRQGWQEASYLPLPAGPEQAAADLTVVALGKHRLHIVPGVSAQPRPGRFDVMRGEETQVWGSTDTLSALQAPVDPASSSATAAAAPAPQTRAPGGWCVLPGTHSKWVRCDAQGRVCDFHTHMTGELYALLSQHGTPGRLMVQGHSDPAAFDAGVALGAHEHAHATRALFAARTAGLLGGVAGPSLPDYLSGLLVGMELASSLAALPADQRAQPLLLVGDDVLCQRYARALQQLGAQSHTVPTGATERGLWRVALAAALIID